MYNLRIANIIDTIHAEMSSRNIYDDDDLNKRAKISIYAFNSISIVQETCRLFERERTLYVHSMYTL